MSQGNLDVMLKVFTLFAADCVYRDMGEYMIQGVISQEASKDLTDRRLKLIKEVAAHTNDLLDCMNVPTHALYALLTFACVCLTPRRPVLVLTPSSRRRSTSLLSAAHARALS